MALTADQYAAYAADPDTAALGAFMGGPPAAAPQQDYAVSAPDPNYVGQTPFSDRAQPVNEDAYFAGIAAQDAEMRRNLPQPIPIDPNYAVSAPSISAAPDTIVNGVDTTAYGAANPDLAAYYAAHSTQAPSLDEFLANHYAVTGKGEIASGGRTAGNYEVVPPPSVKNGMAVNYGTPEGGALAPKAAEPNPPAITQPSTNSVNGVPLPYSVPVTQPLPDGFAEPDLMPAGGQYGTSYYAAKTDDGDFAGAVMAAPDQKIRLIDGLTGQVVYEGTGPEGARIAAATANNLSTGPDSKKAAWAIQGDTGNGQWTTQAQDMVDTVHPSKLSVLADIALPILGALLALPTGGLSLGLAIPGGAALAGGLGAAGGSLVSSALQGRKLDDALTRAALSAGGAYIAPGIGSAVGKALGSTGASIAASGGGNLIGNAAADTLSNAAVNAAVQSIPGTVSEVVVTAAQSIVPKLIAQGVTQVGINAAVNQIAQNVASGRPATEGVNEGNTIETLDVTSPGSGLDGAGAYGGALGAATPTPTPNVGNTIETLDVTSPGSGLDGAGAYGANLGNLVDEVVVNGQKVTPQQTPQQTPIEAGIGALVPSAPTPTLTSTPADITAPTNTEPDLRYKIEAALTDPKVLLKLAAEGVPLLGGGGGGGSYQVPTAGGAGTRGSLDSIFSAGLPAATRGGRTQLNPQVDWSRYAIKGPEKSFFSNVNQTAQDFTVPSRTDALLSGVGDINGDGMINDADIALFRKRFGAQGFAKGGAPKRSEYAVKGAGDGRSDSIPAVLSDGEYVIDAETVALLGNGSSQAGAKALDKFRVNVRKHKGKQLAKGRFSATAKDPHNYFAGGRT